MVEKNYQFLSETLSQLGFGDTLNDALKTKMKLGMPEFDLKAKDTYNKDQMLYTLKFARKEDGDFYFLNTYNAKLTKENGETLSQNFPLYKQRGYSTEEAYNMLSGRAVYKTFSKEGERIGQADGQDWILPVKMKKATFRSKAIMTTTAISTWLKNWANCPFWQLPRRKRKP
jgi:hypothetical protein